jgi:hypothetical protein
MIGGMYEKGHSRPARAGTKPGHVRYAPIAIKFRSEAKCRDVPMSDIGVTLPIAALRTRRRRRPCGARSKLLSLIRGALSAGIVADIVLRPPVEVDIDDAALGFMR